MSEQKTGGNNRIICLGGPTGSGKTAIAIDLAREFNCEVINADSRQTYADFPVITAQPMESERCGVPHHLYGYLQIQEKTSAGIWSRNALRKMAEIRSRGATPLLVGGTGLYFQALLRGLTPIPEIPAHISEAYAMLMRERGSVEMHGELQIVDPAYAAKIHPHDKQRIQRALEVRAATGKPFSWWHAQKSGKAPCEGILIFLDIPLASLEPRLAARIDVMLEAGAMEEAEKAMGKCDDAAAPGWSGIGCAELLAFLQGRVDFDQCRSQWLANTRAYAKRQLTWFRARPEGIAVKVADSGLICNLLRQNLIN